MQPDLTPSCKPLGGETLNLPERRVHPMVRKILSTSTFRSWRDFILTSYQPEPPLTPQVRELYRGVGSSLLGFLLSKSPDKDTAGSDLETDALLRSEMRRCTPESIKEFLHLQAQKREHSGHEAASVIYNHFSRWAVKLGYMPEELFPNLRDERYELVLKQSALRMALDEYLTNLNRREEGESMSPESQGNIRRIVSRFLRTVARANFPEVAANEAEPDYQAVSSALDALVAERFAALVGDYCRVKSEGGIFESKGSVLSARSALSKYFSKVVPGGDTFIAPRPARPVKPKKVKAAAQPPPPGLEEDVLLPIASPARPAPTPQELKARYQECLELALAELGRALGGKSRQQLSLLRLNDVRDVDLKLRVFTAQVPALSPKGGNFIDIQDPGAYRAVLQYLAVCRGRAPRKSFFFETFERAPVASQQQGKKRR